MVTLCGGAAVVGADVVVCEVIDDVVLIVIVWFSCEDLVFLVW